MTRRTDVRGLPWTAASDQSAARLFAAMDHYFTFRADAMDRLDELLADDPDCPGAWVVKGYLFLFGRSASLTAKAIDAHDKAAQLAPSASPRERLHIDALKAWAEGDLLRAQRIWDAIVTEHPLDLLALRVQHFNAMFFGRPDYLRSTITRALGDWTDQVPGAGFVYGMACMALEETGDFERAEQIGRRGVELEADDLWCVHSVAHIMEAQGRLDEGVDWMQRPDTFWYGRGPMRHHLWWHEALFLFETGAYDRVIDYYDTRLDTPAPLTYMEMTNSASLLMRLDAAGVSCGDRWVRLASRCQHFLGDRALTFIDIHVLLVLAMARDETALARLAEAITDYAANGNTFDRAAAGWIAVPIAKAMQNRLAGNAGQATNIILDARFHFPRMGGSNAQRDVLDILLIDCAIAANRTQTARRLLSEYLDLRPNSVPMRDRLAALGANS